MGGQMKWLSRKELCNAVAGISLSTLYRRIKDGTIPAKYFVRLGGRLVFSVELLDDLPSLSQNAEPIIEENRINAP
ncbi:MAG: hypothetical protein FWB78_09315 [Treponema sp.]|nr:hypothetical protein [Treponema sp.]